MKSKPPFAAESPSFPRPLVALTIAAFLFAWSNSGDPIRAAHTPTLRISEVHPNALADGAPIEAHEWVELRNPEPHPVNLGDWTVEDAQAIARLPDFDLPPNGTVLVIGSGSDLVAPAGQSLIILDSPKIGSGLRNDGDRVALVNPYGIRADAVSWGDVRQPRFSESPEPGQSIIRTRGGGQTLSDSPTPWEIDEAPSAEPAQHDHPRPDTRVRISSALIDPLDDEPESVTITNISDEPLITVNWTLTVDRALVRVRSVRIEPGDSFTITESDGRLGSGLSPSGGRLVLRDPTGNWLATASWGDDRTFHHLPPPSPGQSMRFTPTARVHPQIPWGESFEDANRLTVANITNAITRQRAASTVKQESEEPGVWISEVHPTTGQGRDEPAFEWFELTNSTDEALNLSGWSIADNRADDPLGGLVIPPRSSVVVGVSALADPSVIIAIVDGRIGNGLANAGDQLRLINAEGEVVNAISWGSDRSHTSVKSPTEDESIHRASPSAAPTIGRPSPGVAPAPPAAPAPTPAATEDAPASNSASDDDEPSQALAAPQAAPTPAAVLRITEILPAPLPGQAEWVEIHNPSDRLIDLSGWTIGDAERRTELSGAIGPRSRFVIATLELDDGAADLIVERIGNGLNNDADTITIYDPNGREVDRIAYGDDALPAPDQGLSIALDPARWVVTAAPTPGAADVTPLLDDAFRSPSIRAPVSDEQRLPITESTQSDGSDAWMIVSFALIGVIFTLIVRRWRPDEPAAEQQAEPTVYTGPPPDRPPDDEAEGNDQCAEQTGR